MNVLGVIGLGRSGIEVCKAARRLGMDVFATDIKDVPVEGLREIGVKLELGVHTDRILSSELVVLSPGVPLDTEIVKKVRNKGIPLWSEIEFAYHHINSPIIAVTGTNGKSTTAALINAILLADGRKSHIGGNIAPGRPLSSLIFELEKDSLVVCEVSSFQLETIVNFRPHIAVLTNLAQDHLNRHRSFEEYINLKKRIFMNQTGEDFAVVNSKNSTTVSKIRAMKFFFSENGVIKGSFLSNGEIFFKNGAKERICSVGIVKPQHGLGNVLASVVVCTILGVKKESMISGIENFKGLPHRMEEIGSIDGVRFINNSMCTNPEAATHSLSVSRTPIILIAGGRDKGADFSHFAKLVKEKIKHLVLIGEAKLRLASMVRGFGFESISFAESINEAVEIAKRYAIKGDTILFSPGCSSFDMFRDFEERGNKFKEVFTRYKR